MGTNLVFLGNNGQLVTDSLKVAETFGKLHKHVIRAIEELFVSAQNWAETDNQIINSIFSHSEYDVTLNNGTGATKKSPMYIMNRDGFTLLAMGFTGKKALAFKLKYIEAFNRMEKELKQDNPSISSDISLKEFAKRVYESECEKEKVSEELLRLKRENALLQESCSTIIPRLEKLEKQLAVGGSEKEKKEAALPPKYEIKIKKMRIYSAKEIRAKFPGCITVTELHRWFREKNVYISRPDLYAYFRENGYISKEDSTYNCPTEISIKNGWMIAAGSGTLDAGYVRRYFTPYITPEGKEHFRNELSCVMPGMALPLFAKKQKKEE